MSETSPTKRRTRTELDSIRNALYETLAADNPATVRQVFYRLVSAGVIEKTEVEYKGRVCRLLAEMRRDGSLPFDWIADNTRWMRKPTSFSSPEQALRQTAEFYRRAVWDEQNAYVEVWLEKDALSGVIYDVTAAWDVPLMPTRGYPSLSFLYSAAYNIRQIDKPTFIYYLGDHDPSGVNIPEVVERNLRELAPECDITFERLAVKEEQIEAFGLLTRPHEKRRIRGQRISAARVSRLTPFRQEL